MMDLCWKEVKQESAEVMEYGALQHQFALVIALHTCDDLFVLVVSGKKTSMYIMVSGNNGWGL